jgi:hypothetical protein
MLLTAAVPPIPVFAATPLEEVALLEKLEAPTLKRIYLRCARESSQRLLSLDEMHQCSVAADILMRRSFAGDFNALLAWWRQHRDEQ